MIPEQPELSLVVPCYNEEAVLGFTVPQLHGAFAAAGIAIELILVDNGSTDRTGAIIADFVADGLPVRPVRVETNIGYGNGILQGIAVARGRYVGMIPADGQVDAVDVVKLYQVLAQAGPGLMAKVRRRFRLDGLRRKIISVCYNLFVFLLFPNLGSIDVNGSPKILPAEALRRMELESRQWFLDPEIMIKAKVLGLRVLEMNVFAQMRSAGTSHVRMGTCWEFFRKLVAMRFGHGIRAWKRSLRPGAAPLARGDEA
ncbi:MAG: glycosyltransferase family 2 protein [Planctomycetes bacterium]|nr:glycosyltransferase family 2 protein [Planctomycetota bacterium]